LVDILSATTSSSEKSKDHAAYTLWALISNNEKVQKLAKKQNVIEALIGVLGKDHPESLKEFSVGAISAVLSLNSSNRKHFFTLKGVDILGDILTNEKISEKLRINSTNAIAVAVEDFSKAQDAVSKDVITAIGKHLDSKNVYLQAACCRALGNLAYKNTKTQSTIPSLCPNYLTVFVSILDQHAKEYLAKPEDREKAELILYSVTFFSHMLNSKNTKVQDESTQLGVFGALEVLKDSKDKVISKLVATTLGLLSRGRSRTLSVSNSASKMETKKSSEDVSVKKEEKKEKKEDSDSSSSSSSEGEKKKKKKEKKKKEKKAEKKEKKEEKNLHLLLQKVMKKRS